MPDVIAIRVPISRLLTGKLGAIWDDRQRFCPYLRFKRSF
jgi:hypothetical protein